MHAPNTIPNYLTRKAVSEYYPIPFSTLSKLAMSKNRHKGPAFLKRGSSVIYKREDIEAWLDSHRIEPSAKHGRPTKAEQIARRRGANYVSFLR